jgi:hypothetical protein
MAAHGFVASTRQRTTKFNPQTGMAMVIVMMNGAIGGMPAVLVLHTGDN